jgi:hypothetical protein
MHDVEVRDLLDLAALDVDSPDEKLTQLYLWKYDYTMTGAKALTAFGASLLVGLALAVVQEKSPQLGLYIIAGFVGAALTIAVGAFRYVRVRSLSSQYMAAHHLLSELSQIKPFLVLYRKEVNR